MFINVGKSKWMKVILFITTFAFVGTAFVALIVYKMSGNIQGIAQVNGKDIPVAEFYYQVNLITQQYQSQGIDTAPLKKQIYRDAIRNVIQTELLYQEAEKEGITATKEEVKHYLLDIDAFKDNGKFSREKYLAYLSSIGLTPTFFEEILRKELSIRHLLTIHRVGFYLSEDEINTFVNKQLAKITGQFLIIVPPEYKPSEKEIKEYYEKHKQEFAGKKGRLIVVYQIDIKKLGDEKAQQEVKRVYKALKEGKDVQTSEGVKKIFEEAIYQQEPALPESVLKELKNLSDKKRIALVSDKEHYYLIKYIKDVSEPLPIEKVKNQIITRIKKEKEKLQKQQILKQLEETVKKEKNLDKIAKKFNGKIEEVKEENVQTLSLKYGIPPKKMSLFTNPRKGLLIGPINTSKGILIAKIQHIKPPPPEEKKEMEKLLKPILSQNKYQTLIQMYIDKLEREADIIINRRFMQ